MAEDNSPGWGCKDFQEDDVLKQLNGETECEHFIIGTCHKLGRDNFLSECPYWVDPYKRGSKKRAHEFS